MLLNNEKCFKGIIDLIKIRPEAQSGVLLPLIPDRDQWDGFLAVVRGEWEEWKPSLHKYPICLIVLYCGLAFYEYEDKELWLHFEKAIGKGLPQNQRDEINVAFATIIQSFGLKMKCGARVLIMLAQPSTK